MTMLIDTEISKVKNDILSLINETKALYTELNDCIKNIDDDELKRIIKSDEQINVLEKNINENVITYIATFSPVATDLREIISYLKIANDMERISDYTTNIAKIFRREINFTEHEIKKIRYGIKMVIEFLSGVYELVDNYSTSHAYELVEMDKELDNLYKSYYTAQITENCGIKDVELVVSTATILKYLERAGDHIINIIENMIYAEKGKHVNL